MAVRSETFVNSVADAGSMSTETRLRMQRGEQILFGGPNKKLQRSLRRQQTRIGISIIGEQESDSAPEDTSVVDEVVLIEEPTADEETVATTTDWAIRIIHQDTRAKQIKEESLRRGLPVPREWVSYQKRRANGFPQPPTDLAE